MQENALRTNQDLGEALRVYVTALKISWYNV